MLVIFLNNKLITCDAIIPLAKELHDFHNIKKIEMICFDVNTYLAIKNNIVLMDVILSIGKLKMIGRKNKKNECKFFLILNLIPTFTKYFFLGLTSRIIFLHFKAMNEWPLKFFSIMFSKSTILAQDSTVGYRPLEKKVSEIMKPRKYNIKKPMGNIILSFDKDWAVLKNKKNLVNKRIFYLSSPHKRLNWTKYIEKKQDEYFKSEFNKYKLPQHNSIIAYMLCWMGPNNQTRKPNMYPELFDETLSILEEVCSGMTIFVKPHPVDVSSKFEMKRIKNIIMKHPKISVVLTKLHPIVLSFRAKFFIANVYSTSFSTARLSNIPTIEYTDYRDKILKATKNGSMRPDLVSYFINHDKNKIRNVINKIKKNTTLRNIEADKSKIPQGLINIIEKKFI